MQKQEILHNLLVVGICFYSSLAENDVFDVIQDIGRT